MLRATIAAATFGLLSACSPASDKAEAPPSPAFDRAGADVIEHGRRVSAVLGCTGCHGADLSGENWSEPGFMTLWTSNLSRALPAYTDVQLAATIRSGRRPDGSELWAMPSFLFTTVTDEDMDAVIAFLRTVPPTGAVHPRPRFEAQALAEIEAGAFKSAPTEVREMPATRQPPDAGPGHDLGAYIVRATCAECHGMDLRGGVPYPGATARPDLRMVAAYDATQFSRLMRTGEPIGGRDIGLMGEVSRGRYAHFTDAEVSAVHAYLQKVAATPD